MINKNHQGEKMFLDNLYYEDVFEKYDSDRIIKKNDDEEYYIVLKGLWRNNLRNQLGYNLAHLITSLIVYGYLTYSVINKGINISPAIKAKIKPNIIAIAAFANISITTPLSFVIILQN